MAEDEHEGRGGANPPHILFEAMPEPCTHAPSDQDRCAQALEGDDAHGRQQMRARARRRSRSHTRETMPSSMRTAGKPHAPFKTRARAQQDSPTRTPKTKAQHARTDASTTRSHTTNRCLLASGMTPVLLLRRRSGSGRAAACEPPPLRPPDAPTPW
eukprot:933533-Rhodomonas_salina.1